MGQIIDFKSLTEAQGSTFLVPSLNPKDSREEAVKKLVAEYGSTTSWPLVRFINGDLTLLAPSSFFPSFS